MFRIQIKKETWSQSCHSFHDSKAFALPCKSKRATLKAPRMCIYEIPAFIPWQLITKQNGRNRYNTPIGRSRCLVLDLQLTCEVFESPKPKRKIRLNYYVCVLPCLLPYMAFSNADYNTTMTKTRQN